MTGVGDAEMDGTVLLDVNDTLEEVKDPVELEVCSEGETTIERVEDKLVDELVGIAEEAVIGTLLEENVLELVGILELDGMRLKPLDWGTEPKHVMSQKGMSPISTGLARPRNSAL